MESCWLHRQGRPECLLFFSGWGMDGAPFAGIDAGGLDLCLISDYRQLTPLELGPFAGYEKLHLLAWSMGVWVAAQLLADRAPLFSSRVALAGTLQPIDPGRGLPPAAYEALAAGFDQASLETFYSSMFDDPKELARFLAQRPLRSLQALHDELLAFRRAVNSRGAAADIYTNRLVSSRDRVFPGRNQLRAWGKGRATTMPWPHFPFYGLSSWAALLDLSAPHHT